MRPEVWVPERSPEAERARLTALAAVHVFPPKGALAGADLHADLLVAAYDTARALEVASRLEGLRFIQATSAGVDGLIGRVPPGVTLCDAAGVHDVAVAEWSSWRSSPRGVTCRSTSTGSGVGSGGPSGSVSRTWTARPSCCREPGR